MLGSRRRPDGEHGWALVPFDVPVLPRTRLAADARQVFTVDAARRHRAAGAGLSRRRHRPGACARHADRGRLATLQTAVGGVGDDERRAGIGLRGSVAAHAADRQPTAPRHRDRRGVAAGPHRIRRLTRLRGHAAPARRRLRVAPRHRPRTAGPVPRRGCDALGRRTCSSRPVCTRTTSSTGSATTDRARRAGRCSCVARRQPGLLVRVGALFGWAGGGAVRDRRGRRTARGPHW